MLRDLLRRDTRRFRAYCVGTPKSGTNSIAGLFEARFRTAHEADALELIPLIMAAAADVRAGRALRRYVRARDRRRRLEMDASHLGAFYAGTLAERFAEARFILTVRDCRDFVDSFIDHQLNRPEPPGSPWLAFRDFRMGRDRWRHGPGEEALAERGLYTLDGYFAYWTEHNRRVLDAVPPDRLLVVRTTDIRDDIGRIARFVGVPAAALDAARAHSFRAPRRHRLLSRLPPDLVRDKAERHCGQLMDRFFPGRHASSRPPGS